MAAALASTDRVEEYSLAGLCCIRRPAPELLSQPAYQHSKHDDSVRWDRACRAKASALSLGWDVLRRSSALWAVGASSRPWVMGHRCGVGASLKPSSIPTRQLPGMLRIPGLRRLLLALPRTADKAQNKHSRWQGGGGLVTGWCCAGGCWGGAECWRCVAGAIWSPPRDLGDLDATAVPPDHYRLHILSERVGPEPCSDLHACAPQVGVTTSRAKVMHGRGDCCHRRSRLSG